MKLVKPGAITALWTIRRLTVELRGIRTTLQDLVEVQRLSLKLAAIKANVTLQALREAIEVEEPAGADEPTLLAQTDGDFAAIEKLESQLRAAFGVGAVTPDTDLDELAKKLEPEDEDGE